MTDAMLAPGPGFDKLLVPVDLSPASKSVLEYALEFGAWFGATLDVLYVWRTSTERLVTSARQEGKRALDRFIADFGPVQGVTLRLLLEYGDAYMTISSVAELGGYGAMLTAGVGLDGVVPASSRALIHTCRVPSLLVPTAIRHSRASIERVLLPASAVLECGAALGAALSVAEKRRGTLELLCSSEVSPAERSELERATAGRPDVELVDGAGDFVASLEARSARADYQLLVLSVRGAGLGQEVHAPELERLIARQVCPILTFRKGT